MKSVLVKRFLAFAAAAVLAFGLTSCGGAANDTVIRVGTTGSYHPFTYSDDDGNLTGYDVEVVRLLVSRMDGVSVEFVTTGQFDGLIAGLDAGRFEMVANQIAQNDERREKYLFPEQGYIFAKTQLVVNTSDSRTDISQFAGATMGGVVSDYFTDLLIEYNEGGLFELRDSYEDYTALFMDISNGRIDGTFNDDIVIGYQSSHLGLNIKCVGEVLDYAYSFFLLPQTDAGRDLKAKIDKAMSEVIADGSLSALCVEWFGADYTTE
jgi:ABC-type amino acid transport substrate-binding protein